MKRLIGKLSAGVVCAISFVCTSQAETLVVNGEETLAGDSSYDTFDVHGTLHVTGGAHGSVRTLNIGCGAGDTALLEVTGTATVGKTDATKLSEGGTTVTIGAGGGTGRIVAGGKFIGLQSLTVAADAAAVATETRNVLDVAAGKMYVQTWENKSTVPAYVRFSGGKLLTSSEWSLSLFMSGSWVLDGDGADVIVETYTYAQNEKFCNSGASVRVCGTGAVNFSKARSNVYSIGAGTVKFEQTGGLKLAAAPFTFESTVDFSAMRGPITISGAKTVTFDCPVFADGLVAPSATLAGANVFTFGTGDADGSLSATFAADQSVVKTGAGTLTVTGDTSCPKLTVEGGNVVVDGVTLTLGALEKKAGTVSCVNGGRIVYALSADAFTEVEQPDYGGLGVLRKTGAGEMRLYGAAGVEDLDVREGCLSFSAFGRTEKYLRLTLSAMAYQGTASDGPFSLGKIALLDKDGNCVSTGMSAVADGTPATSLNASQAAFTVAVTKHSKAESWQNLTRLFDISKAMNNAPYLSAPTIQAGDPSTAYGVVFRLKDAAAPVVGYDFGCQWGWKYPSAWKLEASSDGTTWTTWDERSGQRPASSYSVWWSVRENKDYPPSRTFALSNYVSPLEAPLASALSVRVDTGATADFSAVTGGQGVDALKVDATVGAGTVRNAKIAANGVLTIENAASTSVSDLFPLAIALPSVTDAANFKTWKVVINGVEKRGSLAWNGSALTYQGLGLMLLVK